MEAHFARSSSSLTQVARCTGSGAQHISRPSPPVSSTPPRQAASDGCSGATPTKPHPRGSGRGCRRRSWSVGECSGSSWRRQSVGETVVGGSESGMVESERPCQCADRNVREVSGACSQEVGRRQRGIGEGSGKEEQLHFGCGSDGAAIGTTTSFSANADASGACSRCRVARSYRRVDPRARCAQVLRFAVPPVGDPAATLPASGAEEVNMLRTSVENLHRERAALRAELARQRAGNPSALMSTLIDQGDSLARERYNPLT